MSPSIKSRLLATQSDERLLALVRDGHEAAFEALVHRYRKPLLRYCRSLCLCEGRAEEALQQALLNAWIALRRGAEVRELRPWLYRVAHNAAVNAMRGDRAHGAEPLGEEHEQIVARRGESAPSLDEVLALRDALAGMAALPRMQREVIVRTAVAGHSHEEVASALGITDGAVRGLLYRARASLREGVSALTPGPLLAWAGSAGAAGSPSGERIAELAAGGGTAGLGLAVKGGIVALTAGVAITGAVVAPSHGTHAAHLRTPAGAGRGPVASVQAPGAMRIARTVEQAAKAGSTTRSRARSKTSPHDASPRGLGINDRTPGHPGALRRPSGTVAPPGSGQDLPAPSTQPSRWQLTRSVSAKDGSERPSEPSQQEEQPQSTQGEALPGTSTSSGWRQDGSRQWGDAADEGGERDSGDERGEPPSGESSGDRAWEAPVSTEPAQPGG